MNASVVSKHCPSGMYHHCFTKSLMAKHELIRHYETPSQCPAQSSHPVVASPERVHCDSAPEVIQQRVFLLVGVIATASDISHRRRRASRETWLLHPSVGRDVLVCFVLSSKVGKREMHRLSTEAALYRDMLFVDAPETWQLITTRTRYSGLKRMGRGMPTFKQFAFFQRVATTLPSIPYVAKLDDDSALNIRRLLPYLEAVRCHPYVLLGGIHWSGFVPRAELSGVKGDRCGWGWSAFAALLDYRRKKGTLGKPGYSPPCDEIGALLPFPFAAGAGYVLSGQAMRWLGTDPGVKGWVEQVRRHQPLDPQWRVPRQRAEVAYERRPTATTQ